MQNSKDALGLSANRRAKGFDMNMKLGPGEPPAGPWQVMPTSDLVRLIFDSERARDNRPWILAVDGRSGSGKSTIANWVHRFVPASAVVHTDDVA